MSADGINVENTGSEGEDPKSTAPKRKMSKREHKRFKRRQEKRKAIEEGKAPKRKKPKKKDDFYSQEETLNETSYYFENGLRKVHPYYFKFSTFAKGRWFGRTLLDVFCHEFKHFPEHVFKQKIEEGQVCVNAKPVSLDYKLKDNDFITHRSHRHEVPVTEDKIAIVHECENLLVVNKPSSLPCHPCGSFRHNSLIYILWKDHGYKGLKFVHRIDRLTSGLLILVKNEAKAAEISRQVAQRVVQKEYVCRVLGEFPKDPVECKEPLGILSFKLGLQKVSPSGKEAWTTFERISFNGSTSVVRCKPHTGRTHQIRVHLQFLGFPITNDPLYNTDIWGPLKGKGGDFGQSDEEVVALMLKDHDKLKYVNADLDTVEDGQTETETTSGAQSSSGEKGACQTGEDLDYGPQHHGEKSCPGNSEEKAESEARATSEVGGQSLPAGDPAPVNFDPTCLDCKRRFKDPAPEELVMFLHALKYKGPDWEFETPLPAWAQETWTAKLE